MLPMLNEKKDLVRMVPVTERLKPYDIPLYRRPSGQLVLHRIIDVKKRHYIICGDNRTIAEKVPFSWVIAVVEGYYKGELYISCQDPEYLEYLEDVRQRSSQISYRRARVFRPYHVMRLTYPWLQKWPFLLPLAWLIRIAKRIFHIK